MKIIESNTADLSQTTYPYTVEYEYAVKTKYLYAIPEFATI